MKKQFKVQSFALRVSKGSKFKVDERKILFLIVFFLFTIHYPLFTASAEASALTARGAVVMEASTGRLLFAKNPDLRLAPASTAKIMTAIIVVERADLDESVTISSRATSQSGSRLHLRRGNTIRIEDLLYASLMESANDATVALAEAVAGSEREFVKLMNQKAIQIGAADTRYVNATGLPGKGQYITAYDLSRIMRYAMRNPVIKEILSTKAREINTDSGRNIFVRNSNKLLWREDDMIGGKTGFTRAARHCFVGVAEKDGSEVISAVLGSSSRNKLWAEANGLFERGFRVIDMQEEPAVYVVKTDFKDRKPLARKARSKKIKKRASKGTTTNVYKKADKGAGLVYKGMDKGNQG
ncbi:MAG: D-alanyl-D-alanine carboxypeptidase [Nitrospirae bacterium]|nr:D-alanyl-D-alanine carboxypeptidase [Nitrospirota bacterium]